MYIIQRNNETTENGGGNGVATQESTKEENAEGSQESNANPENSEEQAAEFIAEFDEQQEESGSAAQAPTKGEGAAAQPEKTVSEKEYSSLKEQFAEAQKKIQELTVALDNPLVKASIEFVTAKGAGVEIDPQEFYSQKFGIDAKRLSEDELIAESVKRKAASLGLNLDADELESEIESQKDKFDSMSRLEKKERLEQIRKEIAAESEQKLSGLLTENLDDIKKAQDFQQRQYEQFNNLIQTVKKDGRKKSYGFTYKVTETLLKEVEVAEKNALLKYNKEGDVDVDHFFEVAMFSANPQRYLRAFEAALKNKWDAENLAKRKGGSDSSPDNANTSQSPVVNKGDLKGFSLDKAKVVPINN